MNSTCRSSCWGNITASNGIAQGKEAKRAIELKNTLERKQQVHAYYLWKVFDVGDFTPKISSSTQVKNSKRQICKKGEKMR